MKPAAQRIAAADRFETDRALVERVEIALATAREAVYFWSNPTVWRLVKLSQAALGPAPSLLQRMKRIRERIKHPIDGSLLINPPRE